MLLIIQYTVKSCIYDSPAPGLPGSASKQNNIKMLNLSLVSMGKYRTSSSIRVGFGVSYNTV